jgi:hypothetical protein
VPLESAASRPVWAYVNASPYQVKRLCWREPALAAVRGSCAALVHEGHNRVTCSYFKWWDVEMVVVLMVVARTVLELVIVMRPMPQPRSASLALVGRL